MTATGVEWAADGRAFRSACGRFSVAETAHTPGLWFAVDADLGRIFRGTLAACRRWCEGRA
jgi:hypothetical protein